MKTLAICRQEVVGSTRRRAVGSFHFQRPNVQHLGNSVAKEDRLEEERDRLEAERKDKWEEAEKENTGAEGSDKSVAVGNAEIIRL